MNAYDSFKSYSSPPYGTIFAGHFNEDDCYMTSRQSGMTDWLIAYTVEGNGYFKTPSGERICSAGDIVLLRSGVAHQYGTMPGGRWNFIWAHFSQITETGFLPNEEILIQPIGNVSMKNRIYLSLKNVLHDSREQRPLWQLICENEIRGILLLIAEGQKRVDPRIEESLHYLSKNMNQNIRIGDIANAVGLSESRLSHLFKKETGATIVETLNNMRIRQAALLMKHMGRTASEAALDVGFQNYNHFALLFRQHYKMAPREYRQMETYIDER